MTASFSIEGRPSPNHGPRPPGVPVDILLLHYTGMPSEEGALAWLADPSSGVSCHYLVFENGRIFGMVAEDRRAWHAGLSSWDGDTDVNSRSIGIEIANPGHEYGYRDFPAVQIAAVIRLSRDLLARHPIPQHRVLAHSDVAPARKDDPGERFPWQQLCAAGIGHWVPPAPLGAGPMLRCGDRGPEVAALHGKLRAYGYGVGEGPQFDATTEAVVRAFQRHFRPARVDGVVDASTLATLDRLLASRP